MEHRRSPILSRIKDAVKLVERMATILGHRGRNGQLQRWKLGERLIEFAGCEQEEGKPCYKGDPARPPLLLRRGHGFSLLAITVHHRLERVDGCGSALSRHRWLEPADDGGRLLSGAPPGAVTRPAVPEAGKARRAAVVLHRSE
jgi:hypothetical protein